MPCFARVYRLFRALYFSYLRLHFLQNNAKRSKSMPCVVVKASSVKGVQTTDGGVHYLTKEGAEMSTFPFYYRLFQLKHSNSFLMKIKSQHPTELYPCLYHSAYPSML